MKLLILEINFKNFSFKLRIQRYHPVISGEDLPAWMEEKVTLGPQHSSFAYFLNLPKLSLAYHNSRIAISPYTKCQNSRLKINS